MRIRRSITGLLLSAIVAVATPVSAQWYFQSEESAFGGDGVSILFTGKGNYGLGIRCEGDELLALFSTPDTSFDEQTMQVANATTPILLVRVDQNDPFELDSFIFDNEGSAWSRAEISPPLVDQIKNATSGVSVAMRLLGDIYHETRFNVSGSTANATKLEESCAALQ